MFTSHGETMNMIFHSVESEAAGTSIDLFLSIRTEISWPQHWLLTFNITNFEH